MDLNKVSEAMYGYTAYGYDPDWPAQHDPDPHNVQYLLSILRGDGEASEAQQQQDQQQLQQQQQGPSYGASYQAQYPYGVYIGPVTYPSSSRGELVTDPAYSHAPSAVTDPCQAETPTPTPTPSQAPREAHDSPTPSSSQVSTGADPRKKASPAPPSPSRSRTDAGSDPRKRPSSSEGTQDASKKVKESEIAESPRTQSAKRGSTPPKTTAKPTRTLLSLPAALPTLRTLSKSPKFLRLLMTLKRQQDTLERSLKYEYDELVSGKKSKEEVAKWKSEALERWDEQMELQQVQLGDAGLPNFWKTRSVVVRQAQREVLDVLGGMVGGK